MKTYKVACTWEVCGELEINANSLEEAVNIAEEDDNLPLPEASYIDGSFRTDKEMSEHLNKE